MFSEYAGMSFKDFIVDIKLTIAENKLKDKNAKISEIADKLGYFNVSYFIKIFKEKYGYTPKQYFNKFHAYEENGDDKLLEDDKLPEFDTVSKEN